MIGARVKTSRSRTAFAFGAFTLTPIIAHLEEKRRELMDVYARLAIALLFMPFADEQTIQRLVRMLLEGLEE